MTRRQSLYLLGLLAAANLLHYAVRNVAFPLYDALRAGFDAGEAELGLVGTAFMVPHATGTALLGWLGDRMDRRRLLAGGVALWSAAAVLAAIAESMGGFLAARALAGVGTAACVPVANALICDVFSPERAARAVSVFNLGLFLGGVVGVSLGEALGFPVALWVVAAPGALLALLVLAAPVPAAPLPGAVRAVRASGSVTIPRRRAPTAVFAGDVGAVFAVPAFRWTALGSVLMAFAAGAYVAWMVELLHQKGLSGVEASALFGLALGGGLAGVLTGGAVADRLRRGRPHGRQLAVAIGFGSAVPFAVLAIELAPGRPFELACCALMFFVSWYHAPLAASVDELAPPGREATAQGLYLFLMHLVGTAPSSYVVGLAAAEVGLGRALYLPTVSMALAAAVFLAAARSVRRAATVLQRDL